MHGVLGVVSLSIFEFSAVNVLSMVCFDEKQASLPVHGWRYAWEALCRL